MPDTPGKRQRQAAKARRRETKDERRAARNALRGDPGLASGVEDVIDDPQGVLKDEPAPESGAEPTR